MSPLSPQHLRNWSKRVLSSRWDYFKNSCLENFNIAKFPLSFAPSVRLASIHLCLCLILILFEGTQSRTQHLYSGQNFGRLQLGYSNIQAEKASFIQTLLSPWLSEPVQADYGLASSVALCTLNTPVGTVFDLDYEVENAWKGLASQLGPLRGSPWQGNSLCSLFLAWPRGDIKRRISPTPCKLKNIKVILFQLCSLKPAGFQIWVFFSLLIFSRHKHF